MGKKLSISEIIQRSYKKHGVERYLFDESVYVNARSKIKIYCTECEEYFYQTVDAHINAGKGCAKCAGVKKLTNDEVIEDFKKAHGEIKFKYHMVKYKGDDVKVKIHCTECKDYFLQTPGCHKSGSGCPICAGKNNGHRCRKNIKNVISDFVQVHGNIYRYDKIEYFCTNTKVKIFCNTCQEYFWQKPSKHILGQGCPKCKNSHGESRVEKWIKENNLKYITQKRFSDCKSKRTLPFDFYLPEKNTLIEYDGEQHFKPKEFGGISKEKAEDNFKHTQNNDNIKNDYCKDNGIKLIRIPYTEFDRIEEILKNSIQAF